MKLNESGMKSLAAGKQVTHDAVCELKLEI